MSEAALFRISLCAVLSIAATCAKALPTSPLEDSVCGSFKEWAAFAMWTSAAGTVNPKALSRVPSATKVTHGTRDGRTLHGYRLAPSGISKGTILFAQGNAMLADQLLEPLGPLSRAGFEVLVYDFRGYGNSNGKARFQAIVSDYSEIARSLAEEKKGKLFFYGVSFGGIVLMNALRSVSVVDKVVIDSSPSTISDMGCPAAYDPIANVPASARSILVIVGEQDRVIPPARSAELAAKVTANGGKVERNSSFPHPFMEQELSVLLARLKLITNFLDAN